MKVESTRHRTSDVERRAPFDLRVRYEPVIAGEVALVRRAPSRGEDNPGADSNYSTQQMRRASAREGGSTKDVYFQSRMCDQLCRRRLQQK